MRRTERVCRTALACLTAGLLACGGDDGPVDPLRGASGAGDGPALDTAARSEPDRTWDGGVAARDIRWGYNFATELKSSISVVGFFRITFVNTNQNRDVEAGVLIRLVGPDGFQHVPETPLRRIAIPTAGTLRIRENFIVEVKDRSTANGIEHLTISLF